ncbi:proline-rich protein 36-like [Delphinapterus leucas]|uniref:Proline-rich protein 36-like n=1 Tax=Delphinapterus leucas TaxID=9749 RepID=A0A7F8JZS4_DELLE|nr:proline-rich protein 36-like [Delphinapterus leucas]
MSKVTLHVGGAWDLESSSSDFSIVGLELLEMALWSQQSSPQAQTPPVLASALRTTRPGGKLALTPTRANSLSHVTPSASGPHTWKSMAAGAPAGGGHQVRARTTALTPRAPEEPRPPRADQDGSAQPGVRRLPGPWPLVAKKSAAEPSRRPLVRLAWYRRKLKGKTLTPSAPQSHPKSPRGAGGRPGASGRPGLAPNLPGAASAAAAAGGRAAAAAAAAAGQGRLRPGGAARAPRWAPRRLLLRADRDWGHRAAPALLARSAARSLLSACRPAARSPGRQPPLAFLMSTDSEKELGVRGAPRRRPAAKAGAELGEERSAAPPPPPSPSPPPLPALSSARLALSALSSSVWELSKLFPLYGSDGASRVTHSHSPSLSCLHYSLAAPPTNRDPTPTRSSKFGAGEKC